MPLAVHDYIEASTPNNLRRLTRYDWWKKNILPQKTNVELENHSSEEENHLPDSKSSSLGSILIFKGCNPTVDGTNLLAGPWSHVTKSTKWQSMLPESLFSARQGGKT